MKFKLTKHEMLAFNDDCESAVRQCPQHNYGLFEDRQILLKEVSAKKLVKSWLKCSTLFNYGYEAHLSETTLDIFEQYKIYKANKQLLKCEVLE